MYRLCLLALSISLLAFSADPEKDSKAMLKTCKMDRVLFLGNSITHHGPSTKVSWTGNWGMAASSLENDYCHVTLRAITAARGKAPQSIITNIALFERNYKTYDVDTKLKKQLDFQPDLLILAIAENVPNPKTDEDKKAFKAAVTKLLKSFQDKSNPVIVVRSSFWASAVKDNILEEVCKEVGGIFADARALAKDEKNYARSEREYAHKGVAAHPGDRGMRAISELILKAINVEPVK